DDPGGFSAVGLRARFRSHVDDLTVLDRENSLPGTDAVDGVDVAENEEIGRFGGTEMAGREKRDQAEKGGEPCAHGTWGRSLAGAGHTMPGLIPSSPLRTQSSRVDHGR